ncbi:hypothetical protein Slin15195_G085650 [Septoria linicola]|uniref:P-loop containing nucleoside triphosphate hydrolase protein n=1 Tax=Septoria linicola TaxID=215465 RepID=A0A9Q9EKX2_9PEZI|nr:hypothetical protein Slin14017_G088240 [Septoria linicola]USW55246.1 hypothetical protein Slin15195_G085650 [Septoria linicola]
MSLWEFCFGFSEETKRKHPELFVNADIDRHGSTRQMPMEVLSLAMGRTGTCSMKAALNQLGYNTAHGFDMHANKRDCLMWDEAFEVKYHGDTSIDLNKPDFWDQLLGHVSAVTDTPHNAFGPELIRAYPNAKVVLVEREIESWYKSFERALIRGADYPVMVNILAVLDPTGFGFFKNIQRRGFMAGQFRAANAAEWRANARPVYHEHYAKIREVLKDQPERLLEYKLGSGWEPLCTFLGRPVPQEKFPHINESAAHDEMMVVVAMLGLRNCLRNLVLWASPVVIGLVTLRSFAA